MRVDEFETYENELGRDIERYHAARENFKRLMHHMYVTGDLEGIEIALEDLAFFWGEYTPDTHPLLTSKKPQVDDDNE